MQYEKFTKKLNEKLFEGSYSDLLKKITDNPDRFVGLFRPTKPKTKLIQNITQSHEIRFGDALELILEDYLTEWGYKNLDKNLLLNIDRKYKIDQLTQKGSTIVFIEQKVRDDHDSTKKVGQFNNFERKYFELSQKYPDKKMIPIMWFY